jgi:hypothetical protein
VQDAAGRESLMQDDPERDLLDAADA